ncbi:MAG: efflux RND transporter permease subunit [Candidatus Aminicenantales bacterium]
MRFFIERPIATAMFFIAISILGVYSFLHTPIEMAPKEDYPRIYIRTSWHGAPPEVIQNQITAPLEEIASTIKGVKKISSQSRIGSSIIQLDFDEKTNMEFAELALREEIARVRTKLPERVKPTIQLYIPEDFQSGSFLNYTISGNYPLNKLRELVKDKLEYAIGSVKGVAGVQVGGGADPEIKITLDKKKMKALNIQPYEVNLALRERIRTFQAGKLKKGEKEYIFKVYNVLEGVGDLEEIVVSHLGNNPVKLKNVADITYTYGDIRSINRINGKPTVTLTVIKEKGTSTLQVAKRVKEKLKAAKRELPSDLVFNVIDDESEEIQKRMNELYLLVGIILSVIFILVFLVLRSFRPSFLILSSIIFSVLITFNLIYFLKISINMLTLGGLALGFGLFVDNSIVVFENVLRLREKGLSPFQSALQGSREVFLPVLASTLTTMSVFFVFAYFRGRLKIYYLPLAIVISSALAASLLVSFSLIPAFSPRLMRKRKKEKKEIIRNYYERTLRFLNKHPVEVILVLILIFYGSYRWFKSEVSFGDFFRWYYKQRLRVYITMPPGTEIERTDEVIRKFEEKVLEKNYEKEITTNVGPERASLTITFPPEIENSYLPYQLKEELIQLATNFARIGVSISGFDPQGYYSSIGTGTFFDSRIRFFGYNLKKLKEITSNLEQTLKRNPRIKDVRITSSKYGWYRLDSFEYILRLDKEKIREYNIDPNRLRYHIQTSIPGRLSSMWTRIGGKELNISVKFSDADETDLDRLMELFIQTQAGELFRLGEVATLEERPIAGSIDRENQQFQQTVQWEFRGPSKASERYRKAVFNNLRLPPGFSASLDYTWRMTEEEKGQIKFAIILSLIIIFMILASLYESFIHPFFIILAVPLALIGVFIAFVIADFNFDSSAYIGVILLGGIVVNNSILLVDHINLKRKQGLSLEEAVLKGARERVRPIFMTTTTTVLGMFPMILIQLEEGRKAIWRSLSLSAVGGLISSAFFILITIPILYYHGDKLRFWAQKKVQELKAAWKSF